MELYVSLTLTPPGAPPPDHFFIVEFVSAPPPFPGRPGELPAFGLCTHLPQSSPSSSLCSLGLSWSLPEFLMCSFPWGEHFGLFTAAPLSLDRVDGELRWTRSSFLVAEASCVNPSIPPPPGETWRVAASFAPRCLDGSPALHF